MSSSCYFFPYVLSTSLVRERSIATLTYDLSPSEVVIKDVMLGDGDAESPLVRGTLVSLLEPLSDRMRFCECELGRLQTNNEVSTWRALQLG